MRSKKLNIFKTVVTYLLVIAVTVVCVVIIISKANDRVVFIGGRTTVWVMTDSMEPMIPENSYILVKKADVSKLSPGDIITFRSEDPTIKGKLNTHEIIEVIGDNEEFVTKGVHNTAKDQYTVPASNIEGVYVKNLPVLTAFGRFYMTTAGLITVLSVFALLSFAMYIPDIAGAVKKKKAAEAAAKQAEIDKMVAAELERLKKENQDTGSGN